MRKSLKQKLYEEAIVATAQHGCLDEKLTFTSKEHVTFNEVILQLALAGQTIPDKEDFKHWGFEYVAQLLGFCRHHIDDVEFRTVLFKAIDETDIVNWEDERQTSFLYSLYVDNMTGAGISDTIDAHNFARELSNVIYKHCKCCGFYGKFISLVKGLGITTFDTYFSALKK